MQTVTSFPARLISGDSLVLDLAALGADYPESSGWALSLALSALNGGAAVVVDGVEVAGVWSITLSTTTSATLSPGRFGWALRAVKSGFRDTLDFGQFDCLPDPASGTADRRSHAQRALALIEAAIEGRASATDLKFTFADGRSIERMSHSELLKMRAEYAGIVAREQRGARSGASSGQRILASL
jgi:hypothetical protein